MHMVCELPARHGPACWRPPRRGVDVASLDGYFAGRPAEGLVLGYGAADLAGVSRGCQVLAEILAGLPAAGRGPG